MAKEIIIDGVKYYAEKPSNNNSKIKIVILQRGWVMVGRFNRSGSDCTLDDSSVIRSWGTTKGLGEIANGGPTSTTKLDKNYGAAEFDYLTVVATIPCNEEKWKDSL
ncbi:MAG: hypothetical protein ACYC6W_11675 [Nitrosotalea sp.]